MGDTLIVQSSHLTKMETYNMLFTYTERRLSIDTDCHGIRKLVKTIILSLYRKMN